MFTGLLPHQHGIHAERFDSMVDFSSIRPSETFLRSLSDYRTVGISANPYVNSSQNFDTIFDQFHDVITYTSFFPAALCPFEFDQKHEYDSVREQVQGYLAASLRHDQPLKSVANGFWPLVDKLPFSLPTPGLFDDGGQSILTLAERSLGNSPEPSFLFLNLMDGHIPFRNLIQYDQEQHSVPNSWSSTELSKWEVNIEGVEDETYLSNYRSLYRASIDYLDRIVAEFLQTVQQSTDRETTVIITADHGHNLAYEADEGFIHHSASLSEGNLHVPLEIVNPPADYPETVEEFVTLLDIGVLIDGLSNDTWPGDRLFREYVPAEVIGIDGIDDPRNYRTFSDGEFEFWNRMIRVVYHDGIKYEWDSLGVNRTFALDAGKPCWQAEHDSPAEFGPEIYDCFTEPILEYKSQYTNETAADISDSIPKDRLKELGYL
jgi:hypothetical protein